MLLGGVTLAAWQAVRAQGGELPEAVLVTPGPASSVSMIPELAVKIGADRAERVALRLKFVDGGGVAIRELNNGNAQFGVFGAPAAMRENLAGPRLVALAALEDRVLLSVMVRADLKDSVRRIEDLRGRVLGVHSNSLATRTTGQQFFDLVLRQNQVSPDSVRYVAAGQTYENQASVLRARLADAIVSEEPFGLRLAQEGLAYAIFRIGHAEDPRTLPGVGFLRGALIAPRALLESASPLPERVTRAMVRTLAWRRGRTPQEVVDALGLAGIEARAFLEMLQNHPQQFSADGRFSRAQMAQTDIFFRESAAGSADAQRYTIESMLFDRWVGRKA
jgi:NitT/TauT family transport system substrate-binding protein